MSTQLHHSEGTNGTIGVNTSSSATEQQVPYTNPSYPVGDNTGQRTDGNQALDNNGQDAVTRPRNWFNNVLSTAKKLFKNVLSVLRAQSPNDQGDSQKSEDTNAYFEFVLDTISNVNVVLRTKLSRVSEDKLAEQKSMVALLASVLIAEETIEEPKKDDIHKLTTFAGTLAPADKRYDYDVSKILIESTIAINDYKIATENKTKCEEVLTAKEQRPYEDWDDSDARILIESIIAIIEYKKCEKVLTALDQRLYKHRDDCESLGQVQHHDKIRLALLIETARADIALSTCSKANELDKPIGIILNALERFELGMNELACNNFQGNSKQVEYTALHWSQEHQYARAMAAFLCVLNQHNKNHVKLTLHGPSNNEVVCVVPRELARLFTTNVIDVQNPLEHVWVTEPWLQVVVCVILAIQLHKNKSDNDANEEKYQALVKHCLKKFGEVGSDDDKENLDKFSESKDTELETMRSAIRSPVLLRPRCLGRLLT